MNFLIIPCTTAILSAGSVWRLLCTHCYCTASPSRSSRSNTRVARHNVNFHTHAAFNSHATFAGKCSAPLYGGLCTFLCTSHRQVGFSVCVCCASQCQVKQILTHVMHAEQKQTRVRAGVVVVKLARCFIMNHSFNLRDICVYKYYQQSFMNYCAIRQQERQGALVRKPGRQLRGHQSL